MKALLRLALSGAGGFVAVALLAVSASAQMTYTLDTTDRGWYDETGLHNPTNDNYVSGILDEVKYRNFFVFDRSSVSGTVLSAELRLFLPEGGFASPGASENLFFYKLDGTSLASLTTGGSGLTSIYSDLGGGDSFGSVTLNDGQEDSFVSVALNATFLTYVNGLSDQFAFGGRVTTLSGDADQYVFAFSLTGDSSDGRVQLVLETDAPALVPVPEPATYGALAAAVLGVLIFVRRRTRR